MMKAMRNFYFLFNLFVGMIVLNTQGQNQTMTDVIINEVNSTELLSTKNITSSDIELTKVNNPISIYDKFLFQLHQKSIIISALSGALTTLALLGIIRSVYLCYKKSRRRLDSKDAISTDQDNIPLYTISTF